MWNSLYDSQIMNLQNKACNQFLINFKRLNLLPDRIPSLIDLYVKFKNLTGWKIFPVNGLVESTEYFKLLSNKTFPISTKIRSAKNRVISAEPDIFHDIFGHCTMLICQDYANFLCEFAKFYLQRNRLEKKLLINLIWFTTETGLCKDRSNLKVFGSSILSSYLESNHCLDSSVVQHKPFCIQSIFKESYSIDKMQNTYYYLQGPEQLYSIIRNTSYLIELMAEQEHQSLKP